MTVIHLDRIWLMIVVLLAITAGSLVVVVHRVTAYSSFQKDLEQWERVQQELKAEQEREYNELLSRQADRNLGGGFEARSRSYPRALGEQMLHVVFVKPSLASENEMKPLQAVLMDDRDNLFQADGVVYGSLRYINTFIKTEAKKYDVSVNFKIATHGVFEMNELTKVGDPMQVWGKDPFAMLRLRDDFESLLEAKVGVVGKDDKVVFLYFDNSYEMGSEGISYSFYEYKKFRSFAVAATGRAYVNVYNFDPGFTVDLVEVLIHELLHLYGGVDHYIESTSGACSSRGRGVVSEVYVPQTTGDIMCLFVEYDEGHFKRGGIEKGNLVINAVTAEDIGWKE